MVSGQSIHGGPLDGISIEGLPGPMAGAVILYVDAQDNTLRSIVCGTRSTNTPTLVRKSLALLAHTAMCSLDRLGFDSDEALAELRANTRQPEPFYESQGVARGDEWQQS